MNQDLVGLPELNDAQKEHFKTKLVELENLLFDLSNYNVNDTFAELVEIQYKFNSFFPVGDKEAKSKHYILRLVNEAVELLNNFHFKEWKRLDKKVDKDNITEEAVDVFKFLLNVLHIWGISPEDFFSMFVSKTKKNIERFKKEFLIDK